MVRAETAERIQRGSDAELTLLERILGSVPQAILVLDQDHRIIRRNHEALRLFPPAGSADDSGDQRTPAGQRAAIGRRNAKQLRSFMARCRVDSAAGSGGELGLTDPDSGDDLVLWGTASEIRASGGAVSAVVVVLQNIAPLRELERRRVEQALFESEKLAATGRLAAEIAHEINNPLEAVVNALYILVSRTPATDPNYRFLELAQKETERVSRILRQMLGFYRPAADVAPVDVNGLVLETAALVEAYLRQRRVRLHTTLASCLPAVVCSSDQIKQVLLNLLYNAQQAMLGGGDLFVSTHASQEADPELVRSDAIHIRIRDTGMGIPEEALPHVFEPFFSTKRDRGSGLGLWVSETIMRSHGGTIGVRSRPGQGTTFTISLPIGGPPADGPSGQR